MSRRIPLNRKNASKVGANIGVFKLYSSKKGKLRYVGMSKNLQKRLKENIGDYRYFEYFKTESIEEAYLEMAKIYHYNGGKQSLENVQHPSRPNRKVKCPVCNIHG